MIMMIGKQSIVLSAEQTKRADAGRTSKNKILQNKYALYI
jgi:hypothetical protein